MESTAEGRHETLSKRPELQACNEIEPSMPRENCYSRIALSKCDFRLCEEILEEGLYNQCIYKVADCAGDPNLCQRIKNDEWMFSKCISSATY
ncbi:MAG: hypothetical protein GF414_06070 [Candidatus Altiarchaeales archaeon]|nr:hypothetical protein [Candidatus Altiarchaeales archaeon]